jgi:Sodium:solute symporter family
MLHDGRMRPDLSRRDLSAGQWYVELLAPELLSMKSFSGVGTRTHTPCSSPLLAFNFLSLATVRTYSLGYGLISILVVVVATLIGLTEYFYSDKDIASFFVGGRSFSLLVAAIGVAGQMIDPSSTLGNAEWDYKTSFFDGAAVPIGGAISLVLNGLLLASFVNKEQILTLPDVLARRYGPVVETVVSTFAVITLLMLIAGNLERCAKIVSYLRNTSLVASLWIVALCIWLITVSGGLVSATSTSVVQGLFCWGGCILTFVYVASQRYPSASPPSIGFPGKTTWLCTFLEIPNAKLLTGR